MNRGAVLNGAVRVPTRSAFSTATATPCLPEGADKETKKVFLTGPLAAGTSFSQSVSAWKIYVMTYTLLLFPETFNALPRGSFIKVAVSNEHVTSYLAAYAKLLELDTGLVNP